jgi:precorrin-4/cobalt-precorrin-4 C11-methyltransferase
MNMPGSESGQASRPLLAFRPSLHSIEQIVHALMPFYGMNCPIAAISVDTVHGESCVEATLGSITAMLANNAAFSRPILVIR